MATLVTIGDPRNARLAPYIGFSALFAALGAVSLSIILVLIGTNLIGSQTIGGLGLFVGYIGGGLGGASFGFYRALRRRRRIDSEAHECDTFNSNAKQK